MYAAQGEYKGNALVQFYNSVDEVTEGKKPTMAMGLRKCKIVLENLEAIKVFVATQEALKAGTATGVPALPVALNIPQVPTL